MPLANERFSDAGAVRTHGNSSKDYQDWMRHWRFDPKLGREREFSDAELAALARQPRGEVAHPATPHDGSSQNFHSPQATYRTVEEVREQERVKQQLADIERKKKEAAAALAAEEFQFDILFTAETRETRARVMNVMANNKIPLTPTNAWHTLHEMKAQGKL